MKPITKENIILLAFLYFFSGNAFAQSSQINDENDTPIHIVRIDLFKTTFRQLHFDYERFNGKKGAWKVGAGVYYKNPVYGVFTRGMLPLCLSARRGFEIDIQRKFYFSNKRKGGFYCAPVFFYAYQYFKDDEFYEGGGGSTGPSSSYARWDWINGQVNTYSILASFGFVPRMIAEGYNIEFSLGIGASLIDTYQIITPQRYYSELKSGHFIDFLPKAQIGIAIGLGKVSKSK